MAWWSELTMVEVMGLHLATAVISGIVGYGVLRDRYRGQGGALFGFFLVYSFTLPFIGLFLSVWLAFYFKYHSHDPGTILPHYLDLDPFFLEFPVVRRTFGEGIASEIVENDKIPVNKRIAALTLLSEYRNRRHMHVIKAMLSSKNDELRLLSFAVIDKLEQDIHKKIHEQKVRLATDPNHSEAHKILAFAYWELIYFELSDETLTAFLLETIHTHAHAYLEREGEDPDIYILLGKSALRAGDYDKALHYFWKAVSYKKVRDIKEAQYLVPYIAEIYYNQRKFKAVKKLLGDGRYLELNAKMKPIREMWAQ